jgi:hypothetical protein
MNPRPHLTLPERRRLPDGGRKAVTIGVGYLGQDFVLLGSDMEITKTAKHRARKDFQKWFNDEKGIIAAIYSDSENDMRCVWEQIENELKATKNVLNAWNVRDILQKSLNIVINDPANSQFEMLVVISLEGEAPMFLRISRNKIAPAKDWELIGGGDVELSRYLTNLMNFGRSLNQSQAVLWGTYIIETASDFVQGVGQGTSLLVFKDARLHRVSGNVFGPMMKTLEVYISNLFRDFCNLELPEGDFEVLIQNLPKAITQLRGCMPNPFQ